MTNMVPSAEERMRGLCVDWSADIADQATIVRGDVTAALARAFADGLASKDAAVQEERETWLLALVDSGLPIDAARSVAELAKAARARGEDGR